MNQVRKLYQANLFLNGNAIFFDEKGEQVAEFEKHGWKGIHPFLKKYPNAEVNVENICVLFPENIKAIIDHIKEP